MYWKNNVTSFYYNSINPLYNRTYCFLYISVWEHDTLLNYFPQGASWKVVQKLYDWVLLYPFWSFFLHAKWIVYMAASLHIVLEMFGRLFRFATEGNSFSFHKTLDSASFFQVNVYQSKNSSGYIQYDVRWCYHGCSSFRM